MPIININIRLILYSVSTLQYITLGSRRRPKWVFLFTIIVPQPKVRSFKSATLTECVQVVSAIFKRPVVFLPSFSSCFSGETVVFESGELAKNRIRQPGKHSILVGPYRTLCPSHESPFELTQRAVMTARLCSRDVDKHMSRWHCKD